MFSLTWLVQKAASHTCTWTHWNQLVPSGHVMRVERVERCPSAPAGSIGPDHTLTSRSLLLSAFYWIRSSCSHFENSSTQVAGWVSRWCTWTNQQTVWVQRGMSSLWLLMECVCVCVCVCVVRLELMDYLDSIDCSLEDFQAMLYEKQFGVDFEVKSRTHKTWVIRPVPPRLNPTSLITCMWAQ